MEKKISVIIPVFNNVSYIEDCVKSILNQTYKNVEVIVVDDCSTDGTTDVVEKLASEYENVKHIALSKNSKAFACRKMGIEEASGEYIMFADGDDYLESDACERALNAIEDSGADMVQFGVFIENSGKLNQKRIDYKNRVMNAFDETFIEGELLEKCFIEKQFNFVIWNKLIKADICKAAMENAEEGEFPKANDLYGMFLILHKANSIKIITDRLYHYCFGRGMTGRAVMDMDNFILNCKSLEVLNALKRYAETLPESEKERLAKILESIESGFAAEQIARWNDNVELKDKTVAFEHLCSIWEGGAPFVISEIYKKYKKNIDEVIPNLLNQELIAFSKREIKNIALYYDEDGIEVKRQAIALADTLANIGDSNAKKYKVLLLNSLTAEKDGCTDEVKSVECALLSMSLQGQDSIFSRMQFFADSVREYNIDLVIRVGSITQDSFFDMFAVKSSVSHPGFSYCLSNYFTSLFKGSEPVSTLRKVAELADEMIVQTDSNAAFWKTVCGRVEVVKPLIAMHHGFSLEEPNDESLQKGENKLENESQNVTMNSSHNILWRGELEKSNNPQDIVPVMKKVLQDIPDAVCFMIAPSQGSLYEKLKSEIEKEELGENIILEVGDFGDDYKVADCALRVLTEDADSYPIDALRTAAFGIPTVMYENSLAGLTEDVIGVKDIPEKMAVAVIDFLSDSEKLAENSKAALETYKKYINNPICDIWDNVINTIEADACDTQNRTLIDAIGASHDEYVSTISGKLRRTKKQISKLEEEHAEELTAQKNKVKKLKKELEETEENLSSVKSENKDLQKENKNLHMDIDDLNSEKGTLLNKIDILDKDKAALEIKQQRTKEKFLEAQKELDAIKSTRAYRFWMALTKIFRKKKTDKEK